MSTSGAAGDLSETAEQPIRMHAISCVGIEQYIPEIAIDQILPQDGLNLFPNDFNTNYEAATIIERLEKLTNSTDLRFESRTVARNAFRMRLYHPGLSDSAKGSSGSYIALSYRWEVTPDQSPPEDHMHLPTSPKFFAAVCSLLEPGQGLWFDTGCIRQSDPHEKQVAVSLMDMVYKNAQKVVVLLRDIELDKDEMALLQSMQVPYSQACETGIQDVMKGFGFHPYLHDFEPAELLLSPILLSLSQKILESEYFERAFCNQEFRVARHCSFLLPCCSDDLVDSFRFCTVDSSFVLFLTIELPKALVRNPPDMQSLDRFQLLISRIHTIQGILTRKAYRNMVIHQLQQGKSLESLDDSQRAAMRGESISQSFEEIFNLKAGGNPSIADLELRALDANRDKLSLVLNSAEHPLVLKHSNEHNQLPTKDNCLRLLTVLALASNDALALCGRGGGLDLGAERSTWIQRPKAFIHDNLSGPGTLLDARMPIEIADEHGHEFIHLGLRLWEVALPSSSALQNAQSFLSICQAAGISCKTTSEHNLDEKNPFLTILQEFKLYALAVLFSTRDHLELNAILQHQIVLTNPGFDVENLNFVFDSDFTPKRLEQANMHHLSAVATGLTAFISHLIILLQTLLDEISFDNFSWRAHTVRIGTHTGCMIRPVDAQIVSAIPDPIKWTQCQHLSRCWLLKARTGEKEDDWTLTGATFFYGSPEMMAELEEYSQAEIQSRIFGVERGDHRR